MCVCVCGQNWLNRVYQNNILDIYPLLEFSVMLNLLISFNVSTCESSNAGNRNLRVLCVLNHPNRQLMVLEAISFN